MSRQISTPDQKARPGAKAPRGKKGKQPEEETKKKELEPQMPDGPKTYVVGGEWSGLQRLPDAFARLQAGDAVVVKPGVYPESLTLTLEGLELRGEGNREDIVLDGGVTSHVTAKLSNVTICRGLDIAAGALTVTQCRFRNAKHCLTIHAVANPTVKDNLFEEAEVAGVYAFPNSRGVVEGNTFQGTNRSGSVGLFIDDSFTLFKRNTITRQMTGVFACSPSATCVVRDNTISNISGVALHLTRGARLTCKNNTIHSCPYYAIIVDGEAAPTLEKNTVTACAVVFRKGARPLLSHNAFTGRVTDENEVSNHRLSPEYS